MSRTPEQRLLAAMSSLPGVSCVDDKPTGRGKLPNDHGVRWKLNGKLDRCACTVATGARPTLMHAIEGALAKLRETLGADIVDQAVRDASAYSTEELAWLAEWCEEHPEPETITTQMADEALQQHRAAAAGQSTSNALLQQLQPRATAGREATAVLQEAQLLRAQHSAAQRGVEKAKARLERVTEELERRHPAKRQAVEAPEWRSRQYGDWPDDAAYWRQEEGCVYARRRQNLSAEVPAQPAHKRPRGEADGPLDHWRHGLIGALQYWANGSKAEAVHLIVSLIERLELQAPSACTHLPIVSSPLLMLACTGADQATPLRGRGARCCARRVHR